MSIAAKHDKLPAAVIVAKSVWLVNETSNPDVADAAMEQFTKWGRFRIARSEDEADLLVTFRSKSGMDKWGNVGFTEMFVVLKANTEPVFDTKSAVRVIWDSQNRTKLCVNAFRQRLESNH